MTKSSNDFGLPQSSQTLNNALFERFHGPIRVAEFLEDSRLQEERQVSATKWFDYRFMSPIEATVTFYEIYRRLFREAWRKNFSGPDAELKRGGPSAGLFFSRREFNSV
ncbi:hypothetical protein [Methylobacterium oxalidis]|uniref:hypothetical protein n=1 Tax=Methylobacterium oxalidis TaxID=944322 RepID=UPI0033160121